MKMRMMIGASIVALAMCAGPAGAELEVLTLDPIVATAEHPRNDWVMTFPLNDGSLMLVWSEYIPAPINWDNSPANISSKISTDQGLTWGETSILQEHDPEVSLNVKHPNLLRLASDPNEILFGLEF